MYPTLHFWETRETSTSSSHQSTALETCSRYCLNPGLTDNVCSTVITVTVLDSICNTTFHYERLLELMQPTKTLLNTTLSSLPWSPFTLSFYRLCSYSKTNFPLTCSQILLCGDTFQQDKKIICSPSLKGAIPWKCVIFHILSQIVFV